MDESFLQGLLVKHASGLWVLPAPPRTERIQLRAEHVRAGLEIIRSHFDDVVLDLRHDADPATVAALELSDSILFVTSLDVASLRAGAAGLALFRQLGLETDRVRVVVMREGTGDGVTLKHAETALGVPVAWRIPSEYHVVVASINEGRPFVTASPRARVARSVRELAESLAPAAAAADPSAKRPSSLRRLMWAPRKLGAE
jgi:pilus assembly protein CpaE